MDEPDGEAANIGSAATSADPGDQAQPSGPASAMAPVTCNDSGHGSWGRLLSGLHIWV